MIHTENLTVKFGPKPLFEEVNVKFVPGECYGLIGPNGAGKSTFLKLISGDLEPTNGQIIIEKGRRLSVLSQDQFAFDTYTVLETVLMGQPRLYELYSERARLYAKEELTEEEGVRVGDLEVEFGEMDGYTAESDASTMLSELGIDADLQEKPMAELEAAQKIRVLLAKALFGDPDILLLDEPTNQLDYLSVLWLENYLLNFQNTVIVVSHDRHFLNKVCTYIADVDFGDIKLYPGNYDFWQKSRDLALKQRQEQHKKDASKVKELEEFVRRFSANASKSKQATSRKKLIEKLTPEELPVSNRRSPFIQFKPKRPCGKRILTVENIQHEVAGERILSALNFTLEQGDKVAIVGKNSVSKTMLLEVLSGEVSPDTGTIEWGDTLSLSYFPKNNHHYFEKEMSLLDWLAQFYDEFDPQHVRGYLGRMLFSGTDVEKQVSVLSGGEKARAMFSKMMIDESNTLLFDEPTDHLDLEAISSLNSGLESFDGCLLFTSHDYELLNTAANRIIEVSPKGMIDYRGTFDDYMNNDALKSKRDALYSE